MDRLGAAWRGHANQGEERQGVAVAARLGGMRCRVVGRREADAAWFGEAWSGPAGCGRAVERVDEPGACTVVAEFDVQREPRLRAVLHQEETLLGEHLRLVLPHEVRGPLHTGVDLAGLRVETASRLDEPDAVLGADDRQRDRCRTSGVQRRERHSRLTGSRRVKRADHPVDTFDVREDVGHEVVGFGVVVALAGTVGGYSGLSTGSRYYVGSGGVVTTAPGGDRAVHIGIAVSGSEMIVQIFESTAPPAPPVVDTATVDQGPTVTVDDGQGSEGSQGETQSEPSPTPTPELSPSPVASPQPSLEPTVEPSASPEPSVSPTQ